MYNILFIKDAFDGDCVSYEGEIEIYNASTSIEAKNLVSRILTRTELEFRHNAMRYSGSVCGNYGFVVFFNSKCIFVSGDLNSTNCSASREDIENYNTSPNFVDFQKIEKDSRNTFIELNDLLSIKRLEEKQLRELFTNHERELKQRAIEIETLKELATKYSSEIGDILDGNA